MRFCNIEIFKPAFIIFLFITFSSYGQPVEQLVLHHISEQNGLSDNHVQCIYKDKNEFVWIGTASGLNLMNGSAITVFKHDPANNNSVSDNNITAIACTSKGLIWIGTRKGLNLFDPVTNTFTIYPLHAGGSINSELITCLTTDKNDNLFIGTFSGLFFFDQRTKKISAIPIPGKKNELLRNNNITCLALDRSGILWITTYNGLWSFNKKTNTILHDINSVNDSNFIGLFTTVIEDHDGKIWTGTWDSGLKEYDPETKKITNHNTSGDLQNIITIAETKQPDGHYLLWINGSLTAFDQAENKFIHFPVPYNFSSSLSITEMYASADGWLWMGNNEGLYIYNPEKTIFRQHIFPKSITSQGIAMLEWNNKLLVSGSGKNFLKAYDDNLNETDDYGKNFAEADLSCLSLQLSGDDHLKAGTSEGIADIDLNKHQVKYNNLQYLAKDFSAGNFITSLLEDKDHTWWIFPWRNGIWRKDTAHNNFQHVFQNFITEGGYAKPLVIAAAVEDKNNNIWFADMDEGIIYYNRAANTFTKPFVKQLGIRNSITQILYYKNNFYSFTGLKIYRWQPENISIQEIDLPLQIDKAISSIAVDSIGNLWIATRKGLLVYDLKTKNYERFTTADGLISNDMDGTLYCLKNGTIIFGCPNYLTSFQPKKILTSINDVPHLALAEVIAGNKSIVFDSTQKMSFEHNINNFTFKWAVTDYNNPLNNHYYYQLKGIDKNWRYTGEHGEVEFANLSPGDYTLLLKGENSNGVNADKILSLHFEIKPPFWSTWWFLFLCLLAVIAIFYALYRYRLNAVLKMEKLRNKISLDLHDDIGSTLSSISILSEMALRPKKEQQANEMLHEIQQNSLSLMERMDDIVWSINPKNDSLENLLIRIKDFASRLFEAKEINYNIHIGKNTSEAHLVMEYRQHIYLIMKEAINNLVKYSNCTEAEITVNKHHSQLNVMIKDNGIGFNTGIQTQGNGLLSMKKRAIQMKASMEILSQPNKGTTIHLIVKIK